MPRGTKGRLPLIRGRRVRITRLDGYGRRVLGEYGQAISSGVVTAGFTANTADTDEIRVTTFDGEDCIFEPAVTKLTGYGLELVFCAVEFEMFEILTGQPIVFDADGNVVGIEVDTKISLEDVAFGFELWAGVGAEQDAEPDADVRFGYLLLPFLKGGYLSDFSVENNAINFTISGATTREGNSWGSGPYPVQADETGVAGPLITPVSPTAALRLMMTTVAPPAAAIGARPTLNAALPALTEIAATEGATDMEAEFVTTPAATGPVWWDFGDLEWDYVAAPGAASHVYDAPGTYTVRASQNGIDWASVSVIVPYA